ncbi:MAG: VOC family protein [Rhizobacter sp.]|nr:VOC family protein [Ferruginibacter sp.]
MNNTNSWQVVPIAIGTKPEYTHFSTSPSPTFLKGFDHIPIAVENLERPADLFKKLGFTLKPGRFHFHGIRNQHIKFYNGAELELLTSTNRNDILSTE